MEGTPRALAAGMEQDDLPAPTTNNPRPYLKPPELQSEVVDEGEQLLAELKKSLNELEKMLICSNPKAGGSGTLWIMDQHLDIFFRFAFPFAYIVVLATFFAMAPSQPRISPFLAKACQ